MSLFRKSPEPVLRPIPEISWASGAVFNPGVWYDGNDIHMLFRAVGEGYQRIPLHHAAAGEPTEGFDNYVSRIGYASSRDATTFDIRREPFISPDADFDCFGVEDPRITCLGGSYYITYTALSRPAFGEEDGVRIGLASTTDFTSLEKHGVIGPDARDKDAVIFPATFAEGIALIHRIHPDIQLAFFRDLDALVRPGERYWRQHMASLPRHTLMRPEQEWEAKKIGAGPTPVRTEDGWLLIYHGVDHHHVYRAGLALLDLEDPRRVLARTRHPVLVPELEFELHGDVNNVVFPEGAALIGDILHVYYGAADRSIGHAHAPLGDVLALLHEERRLESTHSSANQ